MKIPRHWAKGSYIGENRNGETLKFEVWGWSPESLAAAREHAAARARRAFDSVVRADGARGKAYDYLDRPLREEIIQPVLQDDTEIGLITRNRYGVLVLNCASVCFVDVDFPEPRSRGVVDALLLCFSAARRAARALEGQEATVQAVKDWAKRNPGRSFRLYRTAAGLRLLFTDRLYDPMSAEVSGLLTELGSDKLYQRLTLKQECFRARLTPKPWRCGCARPPSAYPWDKPEAEQAYRKWQRDYEKKSGAFVTCHLVEAVGACAEDAAIVTTVSLHDRHACGDKSKALA